MKISDKKIGEILLMTGIVLNYIFDAINKISLIYFPNFSRIAILYRLLFELFCVATIIIFINKKRIYFLGAFFYFLVSFFIGNLYLKTIGGVNIKLFEQFIYFNKYFFVFFIFFATYKALEDKKVLAKVVVKFKQIFILNGLFAILGILFKIKLFDSTPLGTPRFGFDGLIAAQNEASIFYLLGLFVFYYDWKRKKTTNKMLVFVILLSFLTGMKAVIIGAILLGVYHLFIAVSFKKLKYILLGSALIPFLLITYVDKITVLFGYYYSFFLKKGFLFMFLGGRNIFITTRIIPFLKKWDVINYIIGGQNISNVNDHLALTEMDFIDLLLFFGIVNAVIFFMMYKSVIIGHIKNKFYLFIVFVFLLLAFFSGHFFTSSVNSLYILIVFSYLKFSNNEAYRL